MLALELDTELVCIYVRKYQTDYPGSNVSCVSSMQGSLMSADCICPGGSTQLDCPSFHVCSGYADSFCCLGLLPSSLLFSPEGQLGTHLRLDSWLE
jgi:hypothetical protein